MQRPSIPIWAVGAWPRPKSMRRVLRCDGILPNYVGRDETRAVQPDDVSAIRRWLDEQGAPPGFDIIAEGETPADDHAAALATI